MIKLKNDYKILYEKIINESKQGFVSKQLPWDDTNSKLFLQANDSEVKLSDYKLIYEKDGYIYGSLYNIPTNSDVLISGLDENGHVVFGVGVIPPPITPHIVYISESSIEYRSVEGNGTYDVGDLVEVKFTLDSHYNIEHVISDKYLPDLIVQSGSDTSKWVKATFTMPNADVTLTLSATPIISLQTEFSYDHLEGFGSHEIGESNIMLRIYGLPPAGDTVHYNAVAIDSTGTERGLDLTGDYDEYFETMLVEMPNADVTVTLFNDI